jgi:solute carrier family 35 protein
MPLPTHHQDLHGNKGAAARKMRVAGISAALFYGSMSVASVFLNKAIFQVWRYRYPASLVTGQTVFTVLAIFLLSNLGVIKIAKFNKTHFKRVFLVSAVFQLKLVLDMSALVLVNIPMYGILKSATTPFVMLLDYLLRQRVPSARIQGAVWLTTCGGFVAGYGDLYFDPLGYALALASAACTACYVVLVGKIGDDLQLDSFTLLLYNSLWSTPLSLAITVLTGEVQGVMTFPDLFDPRFIAAFVTSCASAFVLNYATYLCTRVNDALTTSVVGRTKSVVQGVGGLFAFAVEIGVVNVAGLSLNSAGILWYAYEKYADERQKKRGGGEPKRRAAQVGQAQRRQSPALHDAQRQPAHAVAARPERGLRGGGTHQARARVAQRTERDAREVVSR